MGKNQNDSSNQQNDSMTSEKTNQDYNKQRPNRYDPNQNDVNNESKMEEAKNKIKRMTQPSSNNPAGSESGAVPEHHEDITEETIITNLEKNNLIPCKMKTEMKIQAIQNQHFNKQSTFVSTKCLLLS